MKTAVCTHYISHSGPLRVDSAAPHQLPSPSWKISACPTVWKYCVVFALERIGVVCELVKADYKLLMTRNVTGEVEVGPRDARDTGASGKLILRKRPESVDDVIETRIAVVGNGGSHRL